MEYLGRFLKKLGNVGTSCSSKISSFHSVLVHRVNAAFWVQLVYFITMSIVGYFSLKLFKFRSSVAPHDLDIFFTSVSAATVSSMSAVEMEDFANIQLIIITILMFIGGEVFISMLGLQFLKSKYRNPKNVVPCSTKSSSNFLVDNNHSPIEREIEADATSNLESNHGSNESSKFTLIKCLAYIIVGYLIVVHMGGFLLILAYVSLVPSARQVLQRKGLSFQTFAAFTTVSTFASCGFVPTNENMVVFKKNSGLLLILIPQVLLGNTLYPPCLRFVIWSLEKTTKKAKFSYMLKDIGETYYWHLLPSVHCYFLAATVLVFIVVQFILFSCMEWNSEIMDGLGSFEKVIGILFQTVNSRHTGESVFDISSISSAILVLFIIMMYLPPYTTFLPKKDSQMEVENTKHGSDHRKKNMLQCLILSQLSYLSIFIVLVCITEREKMKKDPLNFSVLNITLEVISAYGNVGFSTGYSCKRQLNLDGSCKDAWYGFVGRWSSQGKVILIIVMFFGRLKKFNMRGGKAWILS